MDEQAHERKQADHRVDRFVWKEGDIQVEVPSQLFMEMNTGKAKEAPTTPVKRWMGSEPRCNICDSLVTKEGELFYDACTLSGQWAKLCRACWLENTAQVLGVGHGQCYRMTNGILLKVGG